MPIAGNLYYYASKQEENDQPAVVLIHGAGGTHLHWPYNLRRLNNHRVLAPDLPGHGKSEGIGEQSIDIYAEGIADWLKEIKTKKVVVIGHSMGGAIAQSLAFNYPKLVKGLVLVSTGAVLPVNQDLLEKISSPATASAALDMITKWSYAKETDPKFIQQAREQMNAIRPTVIYGDLVACDHFNAAGRLAKIKAPTLILCGEDDKMTPLHLSKQLEDGIPDASLTLIPGAGHMAMLEQPERVAVEVTNFLGTI
jgi:pimeloyl-ACP methyl ester carboxylesterase